MPENSKPPIDPGRLDRLVGHAMDHGWMPHKPETWRYRFASIRDPLVMKKWNQRKPGLPEFSDVPLEAGARVKIVMVSRFGDVGITDDLSAEFGYHARVELDRLCDFAADC